MKRSLWIFILVAACVCCNGKKVSEVFASSDGAIQGYDAVAYFKEHKPVKGLPDLSFNWNGATWYFASKQNLDDFKLDPSHYAPQYGGYCAYGTADGHKAPTEPDAWTIVNGKLYLNYNQDVMELWRKNTDSLIRVADEKWEFVKKQ